MTGNIIFDVFIGVVSLFLLYSLLAMILMELAASFLGLRARNLGYAIRRMLQSEKERSTFMNVLNRILSSILSITGNSFQFRSSEMFDSFYRQPVIKYLSIGSIFRKPSYVNPQDFSKAVIDVLKDSSDKTDTIKCIKEGIEKINDNPDTKKHLGSLLTDAEEDLKRFKELVEAWFDSTMERAIGWYKRQTLFIILVIGFGITVIFNANIFEIIRKLSIDKDARQQLIDITETYVKENQNMMSMPDILDQSDTSNLSKIDALLRIQKDLRNDIEDAHSLIYTGWPKSDSFKLIAISPTALNKISDRFALIDSSGYKGVYYPSGINQKLFINSLQKDISGRIQQINNKVYFKRISYFGKVVRKNFWGYIITALFISLGAPFWFDLLNRIIKLRSSLAFKSGDIKPEAIADKHRSS